MPTGPFNAFIKRNGGTDPDMNGFFWNPKQGGRIHLTNPTTNQTLCHRFHEPTVDRFTISETPAAGTEMCSTCVGVLSDILRSAENLCDLMRGKR